MDKNFEYKTVQLRKIQVELADVNAVFNDKAEPDQGGAYIHGGKAIKSIIIDDEPIVPTSRFWNSLYARYNLNKSFFKYFSHNEVFERIVEKETESTVRVTIERDTKTGDSRLLSATGLNRPVIVYDDLLEVLDNFGIGQGTISYENGVVISTHEPRVGGGEYKISGDKFRNKFVMHAPIDGYGNPNFYLSLLRLICSNGMVGFSKSFQSTLKLGTGADNIKYTLQRALDGFSNEEGYAQIRERFEIGAHSWASLREQQDLYRILLHLQNDPKITKDRAADIRTKFEDMSGRPYELYHQDPNLFSEKRLRTLPVECKVYDMINFATEVATHEVSESTAQKLHVWVGGLLSSEYDLEGSCDAFDDWRDFFLRDNRDKFEEEKRIKNSKKADVLDDDEDLE